MSELVVGKTLGKYRIIERLGRGGMASVYKAYQPGLDRHVAVKVMHPLLAEKEGFVVRFEQEAKAVAKLRHPNIVQVIDFGHEGDLYYMVMEFIDGPTLKAELRERSRTGQPFAPKEAARILTAISNAVDYAHHRGMVHCDLKPANIMFTGEGQPVLTDFGIAKIVGAKRLTLTGVVSGTPAYMSPEQGQGERGDERSDIYSLGVILYEMVTGRVPFDADTPYAIIMMHISDPLPLPRQVYPQLPESVEWVILKALSRNPNDRYQTAGEMAMALQQVGVVPAEAAARSVVRPQEARAAGPEPLLPQPTPLSHLSRLKGFRSLLHILLKRVRPGGKATLSNEQNLLQTELAKHKRNLYKLRDQKATFARGEEPLRLLNQIEAEEDEIRRIEEELKELGG